MAEAILKKHAGDRFEVYSAGLESEEIHPYTLEVMEEAGYDLTDHYSKRLDEFLGEMHFGYLITVCQKAEEECPTFPGVSQRLYWPTEDPVVFEGSEEEQLEKFRRTRDQIEARILDWLEEV
jgi:arsenate reductase